MIHMIPKINFHDNFENFDGDNESNADEGSEDRI